MRSVVKKFILPWNGLLFFGFVIGIVCFVQWAAAAVIHGNTVKVANARCTLKSFDNSSDTVLLMKVDCGGSEDATKDVKFIAAYLKEPGPFTCTRYNWAYADCALHEEQ